MGKKVVIIVIAVLVIGGIAFGLTRSKNTNDQTDSTNTNQTSQSNQNQQSTNTNNQPTASSTNSVTIQNFAFSPSDITVKKGTTVTWTNQDTTAHTVSEMDGQAGPSSGNLGNGDKYSFTFNQTGTFKYRCNIHPYMLGTVTVTE